MTYSMVLRDTTAVVMLSSLSRSLLNSLCRTVVKLCVCHWMPVKHGIYIGRLFVGCILYADDILLLSSSCYGPQSMLNVCVEFGNKWDIVFNPAKTQSVTFGGKAPKQFTLAIGAKHLSWCTRLNYLGCIFLDGSCEIDISCTLCWEILCTVQQYNGSIR